VRGILARVAARKRISLTTTGQASASTQIFMDADGLRLL
jgi:hypothetical protein